MAAILAAKAMAFSRSCLKNKQNCRKKMTSVSSYKMKWTSLSLQKSWKQRWRTSAVHIAHTHEPDRGYRRSPTNALDCWRLSKPNVDTWTLEKVVLITHRKDSGSRPGQRSYLAFFQFRARLRSVFARLAGRCRSRLYTFSPPYHFRDNHPTSETITQKFSFLGQFLLDFDQATPRSKALDPRFFIYKNKKIVGATLTELSRSKVAGDLKRLETPIPVTSPAQYTLYAAQISVTTNSMSSHHQWPNPSCCVHRGRPPRLRGRPAPKKKRICVEQLDWHIDMRKKLKAGCLLSCTRVQRRFSYLRPPSSSDSERLPLSSPNEDSSLELILSKSQPRSTPSIVVYTQSARIHSDSLSRHPFVCAVWPFRTACFMNGSKKKSWIGTFPWSHDHDSFTTAFGNPLLYVWEKKTSKSLSLPELEPFQKFTIPLEVCILKRGVQWTLWFVTSSWSECRSDQRCAAKLSAWWTAKRRLISNDRHRVISLWLLANKPSSFS